MGVNNYDHTCGVLGSNPCFSAAVLSPRAATASAIKTPAGPEPWNQYTYACYISGYKSRFGWLY